MTKSATLTAIVACIGFWVVTAWGLAGSSAPAPEKPAEAIKWEYKFLHVRAEEKEFNDLGGEGWELAGSKASKDGGTWYFILKRLKR